MKTVCTCYVEMAFINKGTQFRKVISHLIFELSTTNHWIVVVTDSKFLTAFSVCI